MSGVLIGFGKFIKDLMVSILFYDKNPLRFRPKALTIYPFGLLDSWAEKRAAVIIIQYPKLRLNAKKYDPLVKLENF